MSRTVRRIASLVVVVSFLGCAAGHRITRVGSRITDEDRAAYYALPRNLLQVSFKAKKVVVKDKSGCFESVLRDKTIPWSGPPRGRTVAEALGTSPDLKIPPVFSIDGAPEIQVLAEPDPAQVFRADLDSSFFVKRRLELALGPLGTLQSGVSFSKDRSADWALSIVQAAASMRMATAAPLGTGTTPPDCIELRDRLKASVEGIQALEAAVDAGAIDRRTANWLGDRYRARIDQTIAQTVSREEIQATIVCLVQPKPGEDVIYPVLSMDPNHGFRELTPRHCSIPGELQAPEPACDEPTKFELELVPNPDQLVGTYRDAGLGELPEVKTAPQGFYYRIPAVARVTVRSVEEGKRTDLLARDVVVAQLGIVAALPPQRAVETQYDVTLDPLTGALVKLAATTEAADPKLLTDLAGVVAAERKEKADAEKAAAAATDELALLERERKILDERKKIRDLLKDLGEQSEAGEEEE